MKINETKCVFEFQGKKFTNSGAYVDKNFAHVYITHKDGKEIATTWNGEFLANVQIVSKWQTRSKFFGYLNWRSVRFKIDGITYSGRYCYDNGQLVRAKRVLV